MTNLANNLVATAQAHPDKVAIKLDDAELTWQQLHGLAAKAAGALRAAGLPIRDIAVETPDLEDVFVQMTARR